MSNALVIGFSEGGDPGLMWGVCELYISKFLYFPIRGGFFLGKSPVFGEAKHPTGFEDALQDFILVL